MPTFRGSAASGIIIFLPSPTATSPCRFQRAFYAFYRSYPKRVTWYKKRSAQTAVLCGLAARHHLEGKWISRHSKSFVPARALR